MDNYEKYVPGCGPPDHRPRRAHRRQAQQRERGAQGAAAATGEEYTDRRITMTITMMNVAGSCPHRGARPL